MALTADVKTVSYGVRDQEEPLQFPNGGSVQVYGGSIALTDSNGNIKNASSPASTDTCWGIVARQTPLAGAQAASTVAGTYKVDILVGAFFLNAGTGADALSAANLGATVYVINETTVGLTSGSNTRPVAGKLIAIDTTQPGGYAIDLAVNTVR